MSGVGLGFAFQPDRVYLERMRRVVEDVVDFLEVSPEPFWDARLEPAPVFDVLEAVVRRSGKPVCGHGLALSLGSGALDERARRWLAAIRRDHERLGFAWYSEHLGIVEHAGTTVALPIPIAFTRSQAEAAAVRLRALREIVPLVAFENPAGTFALGDPRREPEFLNEVAAASGASILLDLHNAYTHCLNFGLDLREWLAALDLTRVLEIHVSGGSESSPGWLASGRTFRLDSHDGPVPEPVWRALEHCLPRCPALRGVVVERVASAVREEPEEATRAHEREILRARELLT